MKDPISSTWVQNIWGVGRNFPLHAQEMKAEIPSSPLIFLKSGASIQKDQTKIILPTWSQEVHHEVELAVQVDEKGHPLRATVALDLTERFFQAQAKSKGQPWTLAKSFIGATILGDWVPWSSEILNHAIKLSVNQTERQRAPLGDMIFSIEKVVDHLLMHFPLCQNDIILMGTPHGVSSLQRGDQVTAQIGETIQAQWQVE